MMKATPADIISVLDILSDTPGQLTLLADKFNETRLYSSQSEKTWPFSEVLAHLRACADIWTFSIYAMLTEERPILPDVNERKWAKVKAYSSLPIMLSLQAFTFQREELLRALRVLPQDGWEHSAFILDRDYTVFMRAQHMASHEQGHIEQIQELLKRPKL